MKTDTLSDTEIVRVLAERGLGLQEFDPRKKDYDPSKDSWFVSHDGRFKVWRNGRGYAWNPLESHDSVYEIEEQLTEDQIDEYVDLISWVARRTGSNLYFHIRHASPRTCCLALVEVLGGEK